MTVEEIKSIIKEKILGQVIAEHTDDGHFYRHIPTNGVYRSVTTRCSSLESGHLKKWAANQAVQYIDKHLTLINDKYFLNGDKEEIFKAAVLSHQDQFEEAGDIGTRGHHIIDKYLDAWMKTGKRPDNIVDFITEYEDSRVYAIARSAELFCKDFGVEPIASELLVAHPRYQYAGTLDSLMMVSLVVEKGDNAFCEHKDIWHRSTKNPYKLACRTCGAKINKVFCLVDWKSSNRLNKIEYAMQVSAYWYALKFMSGLAPKTIILVRLDKGKANYDVMMVKNRVSAFRAFKDISGVDNWMFNGQDKLLPLSPKEKINL